VNEEAFKTAERQTFCPYKGLCSYYDIGDARRAAWSYRDPYREVERISNLISFERDKVTVEIDGKLQPLAPGQQVITHGADRNLTVDEVRGGDPPRAPVRAAAVADR
jgi:hypothetical protein